MTVVAATTATATTTAPTLAGVRTGCDVVHVDRIAGLLRRRPKGCDVLFTAHEQACATRDGVTADSPEALRRLAARFAAKEAVVKLLDRPALRWTDVEVRTGPTGAPELWLLAERTEIAISLSHDGDVAFATVAATTDHLHTITTQGAR